MNVFVIPTWYPSPSSEIAGIFFKEQAYYLAELHKELNVGINIWGQCDENMIITRKGLLKGYQAFSYFLRQKPYSKAVDENLQEFYQPAISWTNKILNGNVNAIFKAVLKNKIAFEEQFGKVDLVHAHVSFPGGYLAKLLKERYGIPYVLTEHMSPFPFSNLLIKGQLVPAVREAFASANQVIAVSSSLAERLKKFGLPKALVIPNVIDGEFFEAKKQNEPGAKFIFFTLGGMVPQKGIPDLLEAIKLLIQRHPNIEFRIGGDGPYLKQYQQLAQERGISKYIVWLGALNREKVKREFVNANAFVLPSHHETFGVVYAEALASGIPVLATDCGGPRDIVTPQVGKLVEVGNIADLAAQMDSMVVQIKDFNPQAIRQYFESKFSKKVVTNQLVQVYQQVLNQ